MKKTAPGFTLIELLVVVGLIILLFTLSLAQYQKFNRRQTLTQAAQNLKSNLRLAQNKALTGEKPSGCSSSLSGYKLKFTDASSYQIVAVCDVEVDVKTDLTLGSSITKTGPDSVFFKVLAQGVESETAFTLNLGSDSVTVTVYEAGEIKYED